MRSFKEYTQVYIPKEGERCAVEIKPYDRNQREYNLADLVANAEKSTLDEGVYSNVDTRNNRVYAVVPKKKYAALVDFYNIEVPRDTMDVSIVRSTEAANMWNQPDTPESVRQANLASDIVPDQTTKETS